ncbi:uncharacterized protein LOC144748760 [Ciona intestinalis]
MTSPYPSRADGRRHGGENGPSAAKGTRSRTVPVNVLVRLLGCATESVQRPEAIPVIAVPATDKLMTRYSSLHRLKRTTAWLLRFKDYIVARHKKEEMKTTSHLLTVTELKRAETELLKYVQEQHFSQWLNVLRGDKKIPPKTAGSSSIFKLDPMLSDGVLRVGGRLERAPVPYETRHPAILPHTSHFTDLIIALYHEIGGHSGLNHTLNLLSQRFWVVKSNAAVRRALSKCLPCRRKNAKPGQQMMAALPLPRMQMDSPAFSYTGIDYFGPLPVQQGRSEVKRYGCLFTCMTTRAVHLELARDLSTDSLLNALRRFIARRGTPDHIYSDNGTNLVGAERVLRESIQGWNHKQIYKFLLQKEVQWSFNPPSVSHMGGAWERMIRSTRRILLSLAGDRILNEDQMQTFLLEAESILNSRPLTPVTLDDAGEMPLTPNHLLRPNPTPDLPPTITDKTDCFARRRSQWSIGRITAVFPDAHGLVRNVTVTSRATELRRPIHKLCLIAPAEPENSVPREKSDDPTTASIEDGH